MSKTHGDGGKGSGRRQEDVSKINENWDLIFGKKKTMNEHDEVDPQRSEDLEEQSDDWCCDVCGGPMYRQAHWNYAQCDDCGERQELVDDDYL